jgi:hypothetical protein
MNLFPDRFAPAPQALPVPPLNLSKIKQFQYALSKKLNDSKRRHSSNLLESMEQMEEELEFTRKELAKEIMLAKRLLEENRTLRRVNEELENRNKFLVRGYGGGVHSPDPPEPEPQGSSQLERRIYAELLKSQVAKTPTTDSSLRRPARKRAFSDALDYLHERMPDDLGPLPPRPRPEPDRLDGSCFVRIDRSMIVKPRPQKR